MMSKDGEFSKFINEFGSTEKEKEGDPMDQIDAIDDSKKLMRQNATPSSGIMQVRSFLQTYLSVLTIQKKTD